VRLMGRPHSLACLAWFSGNGRIIARYQPGAHRTIASDPSSMLQCLGWLSLTKRRGHRYAARPSLLVQAASRSMANTLTGLLIASMR
jgi:hypothetical protein